MSTILTNKIETKSGGLTLDPGTGGSVTVLGSLSGTISTAAQPNITSVGTLSSLAVSGDLTIGDKIVHDGDTNTAIRFPAADTVTIETAGSERMRIDSSGNVGIGGIADSDYRIHLYKASNSEMAFESTGTGGGFYRIGTGHDVSGFGGAFRIYDMNAAAERLRIDSSGNITQTASGNPTLTISGSDGAYTGILKIYGAGGGGSKIEALGGANSLSLETNGSERIRIDSIGNVEITSGNIEFANGQGIDFSASAGGGATSSFLDDYEEGTFTPTYTFSSGSVTYNIQYGWYTKIGNVVNVWIFIGTDAISSPSGDVTISLPFAINNANGTNYRIAGSLGTVARFATDIPNIRAQSYGGQTFIRLTKNATNVGQDLVDGSNFSGSTNSNEVELFVSYRV